MTVLDTSAAVDLLLSIGVARQVEELTAAEGEFAAPDLLVFEVLAVIRRQTHRGVISEDRATGAVDDLGDLPLMLFSSLTLRRQAWARHRNMTAADALFVALAEQLGEPLATKDVALARAAREHSAVATLVLSDPG